MMRNVRSVVILCSVAVVFAAAVVPAAAQAPGPRVAAWPPSLIFCHNPASPLPGPEARTVEPPAVHAPSHAVRLVTVVNQGSGTLVTESIHLRKSGIASNLSARVHGIARSGLPIADDAIVVENIPPNPFDPQAGVLGATDCFDTGANALEIQPGGSCTVFVSERAVTGGPGWPAGSGYLEIETNDAGRPIVSIPLMLSRSLNCRPSAGLSGPLGDLVTQRPIYTDVLETETPPQAITPTADCRCGVTCGSATGTSGHVQCYTEDRCGACCRSFGTWYCGNDGLSSYGFSNW